MDLSGLPGRGISIRNKFGNMVSIMANGYQNWTWLTVSF